MKNRNIVGILFVLLVTFLNAGAQLLLKTGTNDIRSPVNLPLFAGLFIYGVSAILLIYALKFGDLNVLYPIISLTFVWVTIISIYVLGEAVSLMQIGGITSVLTGVFFITKGDAVD